MLKHKQNIIKTTQNLIVQNQDKPFNANRWGKLYAKLLSAYKLEYSENEKEFQEYAEFLADIDTIEKEWIEDYLAYISELESHHYKRKEIEENISYTLPHYFITKLLYNTNKEEYRELYTTSLINLAYSFYSNNQLEKAIPLEEESLKIRKELYKKEPEMWAELYTTSLINLTRSYKNSNQLKKAISLGEEALKIRKELYIKKPKVWAELYTISLNNLVAFYIDNNQPEKAISLKEESVEIKKKLYKKDPREWKEAYINSLNTLASSYKDNNQSEKVIHLYKELYNKKPLAWAEKYDTELYNQASKYVEKLDFFNASVIYKEELGVLSYLVSQKKQKWIDDYIDTLQSLADALLNIKNYEDATKYFQEYFKYFSIESIQSCKEFLNFIYPFVKYYQATTHSDATQLKKLNSMIEDVKEQLQQRFGECYKEQIDVEHTNYTTLRNSEKSFDTEKYEIFVKLFVGKGVVL